MKFCKALLMTSEGVPVGDWTYHVGTKEQVQATLEKELRGTDSIKVEETTNPPREWVIKLRQTKMEELYQLEFNIEELNSWIEYLL